MIKERPKGDHAVLMIAPTERQARALHIKTLRAVQRKDPKAILLKKDKPTHEKFKIKNGYEVWCLPVGLEGKGARFPTIDRLYLEECSRIPTEAIDATTPTLLTTGGKIVALSTPAGPEGWFADCFRNKDAAFDSFARFSKSSECVIKERPICDTWSIKQRDSALKHIDNQRKRMSALVFEQEYEGKISDSLHQMFSTELLRSIMTLKRGQGLTSPDLSLRYYLGVDFSRLGEDQTVLFSLKKEGRHNLSQVDMEVFDKTRIPASVQKIKLAESKYHYKKMGLDSGGIGGPALDMLLLYKYTSRKCVALDNATRSLERDGTAKRRVLKEDMYELTLHKMEANELKLFNEPEIFASFRSIQFEYDDKNVIKIWGENSHIVEACIRAVWVACQDKSLNLWVR